jgi:hypothetical protein
MEYNPVHGAIEDICSKLPCCNKIEIGKFLYSILPAMQNNY